MSSFTFTYAYVSPALRSFKLQSHFRAWPCVCCGHRLVKNGEGIQLCIEELGRIRVRFFAKGEKNFKDQILLILRVSTSSLATYLKLYSKVPSFLVLLLNYFLILHYFWSNFWLISWRAVLWLFHTKFVKSGRYIC